MDNQYHSWAISPKLTFIRLNMRKIDISITKAKLNNFSIDIGDEDKIDINATIGLYTSGGKKITSFSISTESWRDESRFELPIEMINPIMEIARDLEVIVTRNCSSAIGELSSGKKI